MSEPLILNLQTVADAPTVETLRQLAAADQSVVLRFPSGTETSRLYAVIGRLSQELPEHTAFLSGTSQVTIRPVISEEDVLANAAAIVGAAREFRRLAQSLMLQVAERLGLSTEAFADRFVRFRLAPDQQSGDLGDDWEFWFHGGECRLTSTRTEQTLDVCLGFGPEFGVLDPWFFHVFLSTTPGMEAVARLFPDSYHDPLRALQVLERRGYLQRVTSASGDGVGLIAPYS